MIRVVEVFTMTETNGYIPAHVKWGLEEVLINEKYIIKITPDYHMQRLNEENALNGLSLPKDQKFVKIYQNGVPPTTALETTELIEVKIGEQKQLLKG